MKYIVIGASTAGTTGAQTLREKSPDAEVIVFTNEKYPYYSRPRLIEFIADEVELEQIYFRTKEWYTNSRIDLRMGQVVTGLDPKNHKVYTGNEAHDYDKLLITCGARPETPALEGAHKDGIFSLWTVSDAIHVKQFARKKKMVSVIGGSFLGIECARALQALGLSVSLLEPADRLIPGRLDAEGARLLKEMLESMGINIYTSISIEMFEGAGMAVDTIVLADGDKIPAEAVVVCTGIHPNKEIASKAGLVTHNGIIVDKHLRTSSKDVFAAGSVAEFAGRVNATASAALEQARVAASNMILEDAVIYEGTAEMRTLKVMELDLVCMGLSVPPDESKYEIITSSDGDRGVYKRVVLRKGVLVGAILIGSLKNVVPLSTLISMGIDTSSIKGTLLEEETDLRQFVIDHEY